ncbi:DNA-methyltransferase [Mesorhizobium sp. ASY16-5R]|uniref:DNA-methyltransferase n=1 Tax=Mesorhizobium sp. ASY16-5R TaxID=3445772 RepID=UPI003F9EC2C5
MSVSILVGDCRQRLSELAPNSINTCVTSPPYFGLRDYGVPGQVGLESDPGDFVAAMVEVFAEVKRVLRDDGTLWLNLGDTYAGGGCGSRDPERWPKQSRNDHMPVHAKRSTGLPYKNLLGIPWRVAFALQADGWILRSDIIWNKPNPMPESVSDRPTKSHEYIFLFSKSPRYHYDADAIRTPLAAKTHTTFGASRKPRGDASGLVKSENFGSSCGERKPRLDPLGNIAGANKRDVWTVASKPYRGTHFATFPADLIEPCILAGCPAGGTVLDPFGGAGTTGLVADKFGRDAVLIELNPTYAELARARIANDNTLLSNVSVAA